MSEFKASADSRSDYNTVALRHLCRVCVVLYVAKLCEHINNTYDYHVVLAVTDAGVDRSILDIPP